MLLLIPGVAGLVVVVLDCLLQLYSTSRYLGVFGHGSPSSVEVMLIAQELRPSHLKIRYY